MQELKANADFQEKVLKSTKPVLVDFFATWCGPCKMLVPVLEKLSAEKKEALDIIKIDTDQFPELATNYMVQSIPTLILFHEGKPIATQKGFQNKEALEKWINKSLGK